MDEGKHDLDSRKQELSKIINEDMSNFSDALADKSMTNEEKFVEMALENKGQHAKAKQLIN